MNIEQELQKYSPDRESVLTIGVFDGVHRGHQHVISVVASEARRTGRLAGVVTFRNHPASVLRPDFRPSFLTSLDQRLSLIGHVGADLVVPITFDLDLSRLRPREFLTLLQSHLQMSGMVVGPDFAMGHRREGDVAVLGGLANEMGFTLSVVEPIPDPKGHRIRSTSVRQALSRGDVALVAYLLGRSFSLTGAVVRGAGRGGPLGFPTANLDAPIGMATPGDGIYAAWANVGGQQHMGAASIGTRPTFGHGERAIEVFLLDFQGDLYGQQVRLEFVRRLRDEVAFESADALKEQVDKDVAQTRQVLAATPSRASLSR